MWAVARSVFTDFFGWHHTTESKFAIPVSTETCEEMRDFRRCRNQTMYAKGAHKFAYDELPPLQPVWMATRSTVTIHCKIAEVALESECDNCTINTPIGAVEYPYNGTVTRNLQTLIWEDAYKEHKACDLKVIGEPMTDGLLFTTQDRALKRLQDRVGQTEYIVNVTTELELCGKSALFTINGMDKILIAINVPESTLYSTNSTGSTVSPLIVDVINADNSYGSATSPTATNERKTAMGLVE